ncbi:CLUMA_CG012412, isoform A [Clunio marinus]|uniref:CLUMA_CG012412, isoform A n=1 Tax=Clunio marinus TaxID=568069 RepID=A0A1J1IKW9_9DIPT|nr:CLUMA_CG012412, isoform A [Clunio marinus]
MFFAFQRLSECFPNFSSSLVATNDSIAKVERAAWIARCLMSVCGGEKKRSSLGEGDFGESFIKNDPVQTLRNFSTSEDIGQR